MISLVFFKQEIFLKNPGYSGLNRRLPLDSVETGLLNLSSFICYDFNEQLLWLIINIATNNRS